MRFPSAAPTDPEVDAWFAADDELRRLARIWFTRFRDCGADIRVLMHDGCPTACVEDVALGYVAAYRAHVNVGFFHGASLDDPSGLLEGAGKRMRHVKLAWGQAVDEAALDALIAAAYQAIRARSVREA